MDGNSRVLAAWNSNTETESDKADDKVVKDRLLWATAKALSLTEKNFGLDHQATVSVEVLVSTGKLVMESMPPSPTWRIRL